ncbi:MAG: hypothetical protein AAGC63_14750 [Propionicimonas sp.]
MGDQEFEAYPRELSGLTVSVDQIYYELYLSNGRTFSSKRMARVRAAVDVETGEVRFSIDPEDVGRLLPKRPAEPEG